MSQFPSSPNWRSHRHVAEAAATRAAIAAARMHTRSNQQHHPNPPRARIVTAAALLLLSATAALAGPTSAAVAVPISPAGAASAHRVAGDIDGDGRPDLVIGHSSGFRVIYTSARPGGSHVQEITAGSDGVTSLTVGDFNGDGYADVAVGSAQVPGAGTDFAPDGAVLVWYGGPGGLIATNQQDIPGPAGKSYGFGSLVEAADLNGDGKADLVVGNDRSLYLIVSPLYVVYGGSDGLSPRHETHLAISDVGALAVGDLNGDGKADLVVGRPETGATLLDDDNEVEAQEGTLAVFYGAKAGLSPRGHLIHGLSAGVGYGAIGTSLAIAKVNGDRYADVLAGAPTSNLDANGKISTSLYAPIEEAGSAVVLYGARGGLSPVRRKVVDIATKGVPGTPHTADDFGAQVAAGDVNGDGYSDVVVEADQSDNGRPGVVYVLRGSSRGVLTSHVQRLLPTTIGPLPTSPYFAPEYGSTLMTFHPNGPAYASIAVGSPHWSHGETDEDDGLVDVYPGSKSGVTTHGSERFVGTVDHEALGNALAP